MSTSIEHYYQLKGFHVACFLGNPKICSSSPSTLKDKSWIILSASEEKFAVKDEQPHKTPSANQIKKQALSSVSEY